MGVLVIGEEADGGTGEFAGAADKITDEGSNVTVDIIIVLPEKMVVTNVDSTPGYGDGKSGNPKVLGDTCMLDVNEGKDDKSDVRAGERVAGLLERLDGVMLPNHSVVPLMTE